MAAKLSNELVKNNGEDLVSVSLEISTGLSTVKETGRKFYNVDRQFQNVDMESINSGGFLER